MPSLGSGGWRRRDSGHGWCQRARLHFLDPSRFNPQGVGRGKAGDEAVRLRALNQLHCDRYDRGIKRRPLSWNVALRGM